VKKIIVLIGVVCSLIAVNSANSEVTNCFGSGTTPSGNAWYGPCNTNANGGSGFVKFSSDGTALSLFAQSSRRGSRQVAASWFNGPAPAAGGVCIEINVDYVSLAGGASAEHRLRVSGNGLQSVVAWPVASAGTEWRCVTVPAGATEVWWQLVTSVSADKSWSSGFIRQRLSWVFPY